MWSASSPTAIAMMAGSIAAVARRSRVNGHGITPWKSLRQAELVRIALRRQNVMGRRRTNQPVWPPCAQAKLDQRRYKAAEKGRPVVRLDAQADSQSRSHWAAPAPAEPLPRSVRQRDRRAHGVLGGHRRPPDQSRRNWYPAAAMRSMRPVALLDLPLPEGPAITTRY